MGINDLPWLDQLGQLRRDEFSIRGGRLLVTGPANPAPWPDPAAGLERLVVPGLIDAHVHFRQPGNAYKEGIKNGSFAALAGGVTTVLDMPNTRPPTCTAAALKSKKRLWSERSRAGWGLFLGCSGSFTTRVPSPANLKIDPARIAALKVFMARSGDCSAVTDPQMLAELILHWPRIAIHAEDETVFAASATGHADRRPRSSVVSALQRLETALELAEKRAGRMPETRLILLHLATIEEVAWVRRMKARGFDLYAETCPHYLYFTGDDLARYGPEIQVNPPIRSADDQAALWQGLADGTIDLFSSDHAPHTPLEKAADNPPSGIPGVERMWPLLALAAESGRISWARALAVAAANPARCYGMTDRGVIADGARADLVVLKRLTGQKINAQKKVFTRAGYDAYRHLQFPWEVERVLIKGRPAWEQETMRAAPLAEEVYAVNSSC